MTRDLRDLQARLEAIGAMAAGSQASDFHPEAAKVGNPRDPRDLTVTVVTAHFAPYREHARYHARRGLQALLVRERAEELVGDAHRELTAGKAALAPADTRYLSELGLKAAELAQKAVLAAEVSAAAAAAESEEGWVEAWYRAGKARQQQIATRAAEEAAKLKGARR